MIITKKLKAVINWLLKIEDHYWITNESIHNFKPNEDTHLPDSPSQTRGNWKTLWQSSPPPLRVGFFYYFSCKLFYDGAKNYNIILCISIDRELWWSFTKVAHRPLVKEEAQHELHNINKNIQSKNTKTHSQSDIHVHRDRRTRTLHYKYKRVHIDSNVSHM